MTVIKTKWTMAITTKMNPTKINETPKTTIKSKPKRLTQTTQMMTATYRITPIKMITSTKTNPMTAIPTNKILTETEIMRKEASMPTRITTEIKTLMTGTKH